ncbi:hypothetical protein ACFSC6_06410 [Rufibacter sediminis]
MEKIRGRAGEVKVRPEIRWVLRLIPEKEHKNGGLPEDTQPEESKEIRSVLGLILGNRP